MEPPMKTLNLRSTRGFGVLTFTRAVYEDTCSESSRSRRSRRLGMRETPPVQLLAHIDVALADGVQHQPLHALQRQPVLPDEGLRVWESAHQPRLEQKLRYLEAL